MSNLLKFHAFHETYNGYIPVLITYCLIVICLRMVMAIFQIVNHGDRFENKAILLIHFSARYTSDVSSFLFLL